MATDLQLRPGGPPDELLSCPMELEDETIVVTEAAPRKSSPYVCKDDKFALPTQKSYKQQFAQLYYTRVMTLRPRILPLLSAKHPTAPVTRILDMETGKYAAVVGVLYKDMKLKPSIMDEYVKDRGAGGMVLPTKRTSEEDYLVLEDVDARMRLVGDQLDVAALVSGVVVGVVGSSLEDGSFQVEHVVYPAPAPQAAPPPPPAPEGPRYVALVSGLGLSDKSDPLSTQLLIDYLSGHLGSPQDQEMCRSVVRLVVAGNTVEKVKVAATGQLGAKAQAKVVSPLLHMDQALTQLVASMPVDLMPGAHDFSNFVLPQAPMHPCILPSSAAYTTLNLCSNPHAFQLGGVEFLGTSGQNVDDVVLYSSLDSPLDAMEAMVTWQHVAPTAPDTLGTYPFADSDPYLLEAPFHVFFAGNQKEYGTRVVEGPAGQSTRLISVPSFSDTGALVLVNIDTLEPHVMHFTAAALAPSAL